RLDTLAAVRGAGDDFGCVADTCAEGRDAGIQAVDTAGGLASSSLLSPAGRKKARSRPSTASLLASRPSRFLLSPIPHCACGCTERENLEQVEKSACRRRNFSESVCWFHTISCSTFVGYDLVVAYALRLLR